VLILAAHGHPIQLFVLNFVLLCYFTFGCLVYLPLLALVCCACATALCCISYQLTAVVHHLGEYAFAGHYVTSARCQNSDEKVEAQSNRAHRSDTVKAPEGDGVVAVGDDAIVDLTSDEAPSGSKESEDRSKHGGWVHFDDSVTKPMDAKSVQNLAEESGYIYFFTALSSS
jgi:hypothetical protein